MSTSENDDESNDGHRVRFKKGRGEREKERRHIPEGREGLLCGYPFRKQGKRLADGQMREREAGNVVTGNVRCCGGVKEEERRERRIESEESATGGGLLLSPFGYGWEGKMHTLTW